MSAIIEPESAIWWERGDGDASTYYRVRIIACPEDRNVTLIREYPAGPSESIELKLESLVAIEGALLNARLWLERAVKQCDELRAAEEVAEGVAPTETDDSDPGMAAALQIMSSLARLRGRS